MSGLADGKARRRDEDWSEPRASRANRARRAAGRNEVAAGVGRRASGVGGVGVGKVEGHDGRRRGAERATCGGACLFVLSGHAFPNSAAARPLSTSPVSGRRRALSAVASAHHHLAAASAHALASADDLGEPARASGDRGSD